MFPQFIFAVQFLIVSIIISEGCIPNNGFCNTLYSAGCCVKEYNSDGSPIPSGYGRFCNMQDAITRFGFPYPVGCCQSCLSAGEGCTADLICCPGYGQVSDPSCPDGQYMCNKTSDFKVVENKCFTLGQYCGSNFKCCDGYQCNTTVDYGFGNGKCVLDPGFTGQLPEPTKPVDLPTIPVDPKCGIYPYISTTTSTSTEAHRTEVKETKGSVSTATATQAQGTATPATLAPSTNKPGACAGEGMRCDQAMCCDNLKCPTHWLPVDLARWGLNKVGVWYKVCRKYPSYAWRKPSTWFDY